LQDLGRGANPPTEEFFQLPADADKAAAQAVDKNAMTVGSPTHVLIIDDEENIRDALSMVFGRAGFRTTCAASVGEAISKLSLRPTHLTLDLHLPDGHGTKVLAYIRRHGLPVHVAVVTGAMDLELLAEVSRLKPDHVFQKPFRPGEIVAWICGAQTRAALPVEKYTAPDDVSEPPPAPGGETQGNLASAPLSPWERVG
jgi:DNA-binding response OmpR family regulator